MRNETINKHALAIAEIRSEIKKQQKKIQLLSKKNIVEEHADIDDRKYIVLIRALAVCYALGLCLGENKILFGFLLLYVALLMLTLDAGDVFKTQQLSLFWKKEPAPLVNIRFSDILDAIDSLQKSNIKIPDDFICLITHNIITYPVCIVDRKSNKKLPGVYEKSELLRWLNKAHSKIPSMNIPFDAKKHKVVGDEETRLKIQAFMKEQFISYSSNRSTLKNN